MTRLRLWWRHYRSNRTPDASDRYVRPSYPYAESGDWALVDTALRSTIVRGEGLSVQ